MARRARKKSSNIVVWVILGLLVVGLAGFGIGGFGSTAVEIGSVGNSSITAQAYARALQAELRAQQAQGGPFTSVSAMRAAGLDRAVLDGLVARAALAHEAGAMGVSVGDEEVARQIRTTSGFTGADGNFDRVGYEVALQQAGFTAAQFEQTVREDISRSLLQTGIIGGLTMPDTFTEIMVAYQTETRDFTLARVTEADLTTGPVAPTEEDLAAFYEENGLRFQRPATRAITYAWITPDMILDTVEVSEDALRALYSDRIDQYVQPERRLLERLVFPTLEEAETARAAIDAGESNFDTLVADRGLRLEDVDMGEVDEYGLSAEAAEVIFADTESEILGPLESRFGPAIYRVNAVLGATDVPFEEARGDLRAELAEGAARRAIDAMVDDMDDLLAGGATLEELAAETDMVLGSLEWTAGDDAGIAGYDSFGEAAALAAEDDFPELLELSDGGRFALRLDGSTPPTVPPLEEITEEVTAAWRAVWLRERLAERAQAMVADLAVSGTLEDLGLALQSEQMIRRGDFIPDAPPTLVAQMFQLDALGDMVVIPAPGAAWIGRLDSINPGIRGTPEITALTGVFAAQGGQAIAQDLFEAYGQALESEIGINLDTGVINAVLAQFP